MDRYDRLIRDVQQKTDDQRIRWKVGNPDRFADVVLNSSRVIRAFTADYPIGTNQYILLFVERRIDLHDEFGEPAESYGCELFVLDREGQLVLSLYEGVVDRDDLLRLAGLIDQHNDRVSDFFRAFEESGAA